MSISVRIERFNGLNNIRPELGMNTYSTQEGMVGGVYLTKANNVMVQDDLTLKKRDGFLKKVDISDIHSLWSNNNVCLFRQGNNLCKLNPDYSIDIISSDFLNGTPTCYKEINNRIYISDGVISKVYYNGYIYNMGVYSTYSAPILTLYPIGDLSAGTYRVMYTYVRSDGLESGTSRYAEIVLNTVSGIKVVCPSITDPDIVSINIYMTQKDSGRFYYYRTYNTNESNIIIGDINLSRIEPYTEGLVPLPSGTNLELFNSRLFTNILNEIYYSEVFSFELCRLGTNFIVLPNPIKDMYSLQEVLYINANDGVYILKQDYSLRKVLTVPMYKGSGQIIDLDKVFFNNKSLNGIGLLGATSSGIIVGLQSGEILNLTEQSYYFSEDLFKSAYSVMNKQYYFLNIK